MLWTLGHDTCPKAFTARHIRNKYEQIMSSHILGVLGRVGPKFVSKQGDKFPGASYRYTN